VLDSSRIDSLVAAHWTGYRIANADAADLGDYRFVSYNQQANATIQRQARYQPYTTPKADPFSRSADVEEVSIGSNIG
jgi:hypothetical protein